MVQLILGSQSPRRKEILSHFSLPFEQASPPFDEEIVPYPGDPIVYVEHLSSGKALSLQPQFPDAVILTADTIVFKDGKVYGKPKNLQDAFNSVSELSGSWHSVFTAVTLLKNNQHWTLHEETRVLFNHLTPEMINHYHNRLHWNDKAGGYAIQMPGGLIVERIEGCYYNVMGLPINSVRKLLMNIDINLWDYT